MNGAPDVLERRVLQPGKAFIKAGEENSRAYVVQSGEVIAYTEDGNRKVEIDRYGPGTIIGESALLVDEEAKVSYEAVTNTTVVTITRQDFQKRLSRTDKSIRTILDHAVKKINYYENIEMIKALERAEIDDTALQLVRGLLSGLSEDKKTQYEHALLPHLNGLIKEIKNLKKDKAKTKAAAE